jgi:hypothetical protein
MPSRVLSLLGFLPCLLCAHDISIAQAAQVPLGPPSERTQRDADRVMEWIKFHGRLPRRAPHEKPHPAAAAEGAARRPEIARAAPAATPAPAADKQASALPVIDSPWPRRPTLEIVVDARSAARPAEPDAAGPRSGAGP